MTLASIIVKFLNVATIISIITAYVLRKNEKRIITFNPEPIIVSLFLLGATWAIVGNLVYLVAMISKS